MVTELGGDILASQCEAIVSPVDCTGAQGKGLALAIALRYPRQCEWYRKHARGGHAEPGVAYHVLPRDGGDRASAALWVLERRCTGGEPLILFATTKDHWSRPSKMTWVAGCCASLVNALGELGIRSIGIPALGCGEGSLRWDDVRPLVMGAAEAMRCKVEVYGPRG